MGLNNNVFLHGRLTKDPEIRQTRSDKAVCRFSVATDEGKNAAGDRITEFHNVTAWENHAEFVHQHFKKGDPILVWGRNSTSSYEKDGHKFYNTTVVAEKIGRPLQKPKEETYGTENAPANAFDEIEPDGELPF